MTRRFTGYHMLAWIVGFFLVVIGVNGLMATIAERSFTGTVVDNSYVASQHFNRWLDEAKAQDKLGWRATIDHDGRRVTVRLTGPDALIRDAILSGTALHPLGRLPDRPIHFTRGDTGAYRSVETLPAGRWQIRVTARHGQMRASYAEELSL
ncbi:MAG: FixH family protein [Sphingomonas sp.]|nr:FixH family protein [Sphingomonas sp.]